MGGLIGNFPADRQLNETLCVGFPCASGGTRACQFLSSMWLLDPVHRGGDAEHTHEGVGGLFVAGGDSAPFFEPRPEALYPIAVVINPRRTGDVGFVALGRDRGVGSK